MQPQRIQKSLENRLHVFRCQIGAPVEGLLVPLARKFPLQSIIQADKIFVAPADLPLFIGLRLPQLFLVSLWFGFDLSFRFRTSRPGDTQQISTLLSTMLEHLSALSRQNDAKHARSRRCDRKVLRRKPDQIMIEQRSFPLLQLIFG